MKKVLISIFTLIFIISMITVVNAASGSISVAASSKQVVRGNTFTVTVAGTADENITALQSALSYDTTKLSLENKTTGTGFRDASGSDSEIAILSTDNSSLSKSGTLYILTFKVLDTAEEGNTTIDVTSATLALVNANQEQENVSVADGSATVTIKEDTTTPVNPGNENNDDGGDKEQTPSTTPKDEGDNSDDKSSSPSKSTDTPKSSDNDKESSLPQTGIEDVSIIAIAGLSIFAVISYRLYKKYNNI